MEGNDNRASDDQALDAELRAHFAAERQGIRVSHFESVMAKAEKAKAVHSLRPRRANSRVFSWVGAGVLAAALLAAVYLGSLVDSGDGMPTEFNLAALPAPVAVSEEELVADLNRTTRWQAPSDQWLVAQADLDVLGLPDLGDPAADPKEMNSWM